MSVAASIGKVIALVLALVLGVFLTYGMLRLVGQERNQTASRMRRRAFQRS